MALVFFSGFEAGDLGEWSSTVGSPAVVETQKKTGTFAMQCDTTGGAATAYVDSGDTSEYRATFYLYIASAPSGEVIILGKTGSSEANLRLQTDRTLKIYDNITFLAAGNTTLNLNTWYRIALSCWTFSYKVYINGNLEMGTTESISLTGILGVCTSVTTDLYFDDFVLEDTRDDDDLGDIRVLRASPNAAGEYAEFDTVSGYENCDEVPTDGVTTIVDDSGVGSIHRECYNLQDATTIGVGASDTVKAVNVLINYADAGETAIGIIVRDDGTDYTTATGTVGKAYTWKNKLYDTNAPRASAWTPAIFTAFQSGGYDEGSKDMYMSTVMDMVAFIPVVAGWSHKYIGVANASIGKICGVAKASILKVNGVA